MMRKLIKIGNIIKKDSELTVKTVLPESNS